MIKNNFTRREICSKFSSLSFLMLVNVTVNYPSTFMISDNLTHPVNHCCTETVFTYGCSGGQSQKL